MHYINLNGKILPAENPTLTTDNRAFRYGYGLFETMLCADGNILLKEYHWERLFDGLQQLYLELPRLMNATYFENEIKRTIQKNTLDHLCRVRLQLYATSGGIFEVEHKQPGFIIECFAVEKNITRLNENGLVAGIAQALKKSADSLANVKSCNALIYAMAGQQAKERKWNDALLLNTNDNIIESAIANLFWIKDKVIYTPPLSEGCVAGVMRRHIISSLTKSEIAVVEQPLSEADLKQADEVFLSNAVRRIKWVRNIGDTLYGSVYTREICEILFPD